MHTYDLSVGSFTKMLQNLERWLDKAEAYAKAKSFEPTVLLQARLAPDQYSLLQQIQAVCDAAKSSASHLAGREQPKHPDTEQTWDEARARIRTCLAYLETLPREAFDGAEERSISLPFLPGKLVKGSDYLVDMALPNFHFHLVTAYALLRHNGIDVGKRDFIGGLRLRDA